MANQHDLMQWQLGTQSLFGIAVTPTAKLMGINGGEIVPGITTSHVEEHRASLAPVFQATVDSVAGTASVSGDANIQQLGYFFDSLLGTATPGSAPGYVRAYAAPLGALPTSKMLSLIKGSALDAKGLNTAICNELVIKAENNTRATFEAALLGTSVYDATLASIADLTVDYLHGNQVGITLDAWAGTMGATPLVPNAYSFELGLNMNKLMQPGLGSLTPKAEKIRKPDPGSNQLKLSVELAAASHGWLDSILAATTTPFGAQIQITFTIGTNLSLILQYAGYTAEAPTFIAETDGIATLEFTFNPMYHPTFANWFKASLSSTVVTLP